MKMKPGSIQALTFIKKLTSDMQYAPDYRTEAAQAEAYYDTLQLPHDLRKFMEDRGQPVVVNNLIQPIINGVLGMEAKTRTDYQVRADDDKGVEAAEALNEKMNEHVRLSHVHRANSDSFKRQTIGGIGWVEVRRNPDPFGTDYLVNEVDWREVHYDWRADKISDGRYIAREKWVDEDLAIANMPQHKELIKQCINGDGFTEMVMAHQATNTMPDYVGPYTTDLQSQFDQYGGVFVNLERRQIRLLHVQYRVPRRGWVIKAGDTKMEYDPHNPVHKATVASGKAKVFPATYNTMRHAWFLGPHLVDDSDSPYPHNMFNLVPKVGFKEGGTGKPFGLVRNMMSAQDEVNFRRSMLTWLLKARLVVKDQDAVVESDAELHDKITSMDGVVNLNPSRKNRTFGDGGFQIVNEVGVAQQHFTVMQDAMKQLQDLVGVYNSFLGQDSGAKSGVAINSLVEQATVTLADLMDNHQMGRSETGDLLLALIVEDFGEEETTVNSFVNDNRPTKTIVLNQKIQAEDGSVTITNKITNMRKHIVLADVQSSPGYRAQQLQQLMELAQTLPDQAKLVLLEDIILLSELPRKQELVNKIKQAIGLGVDVESLSDIEKDQYAKKQKQAEEEALMMMRERTAEVVKKENDAQKIAADTDLINRKIAMKDAEEDLTESRSMEILSRIENTELETSFKKQAGGAVVEQEVDRLLATL
jgi:hypothetical protein